MSRLQNKLCSDKVFIGKIENVHSNTIFLKSVKKFSTIHSFDIHFIRLSNHSGGNKNSSCYYSPFIL